MGLVELSRGRSADEPGRVGGDHGGQLLHDAIETAKGKPGKSAPSAVYIGTLAPADLGAGGMISWRTVRMHRPTSRRSRATLSGGTSGARYGAAIR